MTLSLDLGRSDLLVDAELARFADERPTRIRPDGASTPRRSFVVTPGSLARAAENGMTAAQMSRWFQQRTGGEMPAAIRLLLHAAAPGVEPFPTRRPVVMTVPSPELLDGLLQHPATGPLPGRPARPDHRRSSPTTPWTTSAGPSPTLGLSLGEAGVGPVGPALEASDARPPNRSRRT